MKTTILSEATTCLTKQLNCSTTPSFPNAVNISVNYLDYTNISQIHLWKNVINNSYDDCNLSEADALNTLRNHPFLTSNKTIIFFSQDIIIATITYGVYRQNQSVGGIARIAVLPEFRQMKLGSLLLAFAHNDLYNTGIRRMESLIKLKRTASLFMHFKNGYIPLHIQNRVVPLQRRNNMPIPFEKYCRLVNRKTNSVFLYYFLKEKKRNYL